MRCRSRRRSRAISEPPTCKSVVGESEHMRAHLARSPNHRLTSRWLGNASTCMRISRDLRTTDLQVGGWGKRAPACASRVDDSVEQLGNYCRRARNLHTNLRACTLHALPKESLRQTARMDGPYDDDWLERMLNVPSPPTPPRRKVPAVAAQVALPGLVCAETMPPSTCAGWPPTYHPWVPQVPICYTAAAEAKRQGGGMGSTVPVAAPLVAPETLAAPVPIHLLPLTGPRSSRHARPCRLS